MLRQGTALLAELLAFSLQCHFAFGRAIFPENSQLGLQPQTSDFLPSAGKWFDSLR